MKSPDTLPEFSLTGDLNPQLGYFFPIESLPEGLQELSGAVGQVMAEFCGKIQRLGTCFVADIAGEAMVVSARHCFSTAKGKLDRRLVILGSGRSVKFEPKMALSTKILDGVDILLFPVERKLTPRTLKLASAPSCLCDRLVTFGYPQQYLQGNRLRGLMASTGEVIKVAESRLDVFTASVRVETGNSGGPLLNHRREVTGVVSNWELVDPFVGMVFHPSTLERERLRTQCLAVSLNSGLGISR